MWVGHTEQQNSVYYAALMVQVLLKRTFAMHGLSVFLVIQRTLVFQGQPCTTISEMPPRDTSSVP